MGDIKKFGTKVGDGASWGCKVQFSFVGSGFGFDISIYLS